MKPEGRDGSVDELRAASVRVHACTLVIVGVRNVSDQTVIKHLKKKKYIILEISGGKLKNK